MKRVVFGSANHWTSPYQVGSHAWAKLFVKNKWRTAYLSDPISPGHFLGQKLHERLRERYKLWRSNGAHYEGGLLCAWVPASLLTPHQSILLRSRWVLDHWHYFSFPRLTSKIKEWGFDQPDLLWIDSIRQIHWGISLKPKNMVFRVADWSAGFHSVPSSALELEREWIDKTDLVIASAAALAERIRPYRKNKPLVTLRNGVDIDFWKHPSPKPPEYTKIQPPRAIYVGALDSWFDFHLMTRVARALPKISFVVIGQRKSNLNKDSNPSNLHWLGTRPRDQVRGYVQHAQVGIIPFQRSDLIECVCPLKLYEYMACGLPVVATRWEELQLMKSPAYLAESLDEWVVSLSKALTIENNKRGDLENYASNHSWDNRWKEWETSLRHFNF